jgi:hypothetical protein
MKNLHKEIGNLIEKFAKKQEIEFEGWVCDEIGGMAEFSGGNYYLNLTDIMRDMLKDVNKGVILDWYNTSTYISYNSFLMGLRE